MKQKWLAILAGLSAVLIGCAPASLHSGIFSPASPARSACCESAADSAGNLLAETASDEMILKLRAGEEYLLDSSGQTGGAWFARFGEILGGNRYKAPLWSPDGGEEEIRYEDAQGVPHVVRVLIEANAAYPQSSRGRFLRRTGLLSPTTGEPTYSLYLETSDLPVATGPMADLPLQNLGEIRVLEPTEQYAAMPVTTDCIEIENIAIASGNVYPIPDSTSEEPESALGLQPVAAGTTAKPKRCRITRVSSEDGKPCNQPGTWKKCGPIKTFRKVGPPQTGTMSLTLEMALQIHEMFGIEVSAGVSYQLTRNIVQWTQVRTCDVYYCKNGKTTFHHQEVCDRGASGEQTMPKWVAFVDGYPQNGDPGPYTSWACH